MIRLPLFRHVWTGPRRQHAAKHEGGGLRVWVKIWLHEDHPHCQHVLNQQLYTNTLPFFFLLYSSSFPFSLSIQCLPLLFSLSLSLLFYVLFCLSPHLLTSARFLSFFLSLPFPFSIFSICFPLDLISLLPVFYPHERSECSCADSGCVGDSGRVFLFLESSLSEVQERGDLLTRHSCDQKTTGSSAV